MFWFWKRPWWIHIEDLALESRGATGIQILCEFVRQDFPLPPADLVRIWQQKGLVVTVHPTFHDLDAIDYTSEAERGFERFAAWIEATNVRDVVIHFNHLSRGSNDIGAIRRRLPPINLLIENLGIQARSGQTRAELRSLLETNESLGFVLDIAHLSEVARNQLKEWLHDPLLKSRLQMVHTSCSGIAECALRETCPPEIAHANHLPTFLLSGSDHALAIDLAQYPIVTEGCLPRGDQGRVWLEREISFLAQLAA